MARTFRLVALAAFLFSSTALAGCTKQSAAVKSLSLTVWGVTESGQEFSALTQAVTGRHPQVRISYQQRDERTYRDDLLKALAAGTGPDIFAVPASEVRQWQPLLQPAPSQYTLPIRVVKKTLLSKKEGIGSQTYTGLSSRGIESTFVRTVANDVLVDGQLLGLPVAVDTLALAYNQNLLDAGRIAQPPQTWSAFKDAVMTLTRYDENSDIIQAGAVLGTGTNVPFSADIVMLMMMQNGLAISPERAPTLIGRDEDDSSGSASAEALRFYSDFARPSRETYTWNATMPNGAEAVASGRAAMALLTPTAIAAIREQQPRLPLYLTMVPQLDDAGTPVTTANYWVYGVAKQSKEGVRAWGILQQMLTSEKTLTDLATQHKRGPALRAVATALQRADDQEVVALANQSLVARTWYHGLDHQAAERAFTQTLDSVAVDDKTVVAALQDLEYALKITY